jgi:hypothetical protein
MVIYADIARFVVIEKAARQAAFSVSYKVSKTLRGYASL